VDTQAQRWSKGSVIQERGAALEVPAAVPCLLRTHLLRLWLRPRDMGLRSEVPSSLQQQQQQQQQEQQQQQRTRTTNSAAGERRRGVGDRAAAKSGVRMHTAPCRLLLLHHCSSLT
jgi:hypothetical protein